MSAEPEEIAETFAELWDRQLSGTLVPAADEVDVVEFVLCAFADTPESNDAQLQVLGAMMVMFALPVALTALIEFDWDEYRWITDVDVDGMKETLMGSGVADWCEEQGFPLRSVGEISTSETQRGETLTTDDAFDLIRKHRPSPELGEELDAHLILDRAVKDALPIFRAPLDRIERGDYSDEDEDEWKKLYAAALTLLATCRATMPVVAPGAAWTPGESKEAEQWLAYTLTAIHAGLALRLWTATDPDERAELPLFDGDEIDLLTRHLQDPDQADSA
jgi:hypothetical protein